MWPARSGQQVADAELGQVGGADQLDHDVAICLKARLAIAVDHQVGALDATSELHQRRFTGLHDAAAQVQDAAQQSVQGELGGAVERPRRGVRRCDTVEMKTVFRKIEIGHDVVLCQQRVAGGAVVVNVGTVATHEFIGPCAAGQLVVADAAAQHVVAVVTEQPIVAVARAVGGQGGAAERDAVTGGSQGEVGDDILPGDVERKLRGLGFFIGHRDQGIAGRGSEHVGAVAPGQDVGSPATDQHIAPGAAEQLVVACQAVEFHRAGGVALF